jgi:hypothetical protein
MEEAVSAAVAGEGSLAIPIFFPTSILVSINRPFVFFRSSKFLVVTDAGLAVGRRTDLVATLRPDNDFVLLEVLARGILVGLGSFRFIADPFALEETGMDENALRSRWSCAIEVADGFDAVASETGVDGVSAVFSLAAIVFSTDFVLPVAAFVCWDRSDALGDGRGLFLYNRSKTVTEAAVPDDDSTLYVDALISTLE